MISVNSTSRISNGYEISPFCDTERCMVDLKRWGALIWTNPVLGEMPGPRHVLVGLQHGVVSLRSSDVYD